MNLKIFLLIEGYEFMARVWKSTKYNNLIEKNNVLDVNLDHRS